MSVDYEKLLIKRFEGVRGQALLNAPISALAGVSEADAAALDSALGIKTIDDLATSRFVIAAQALAAVQPAAHHDHWKHVPGVAQYGGADWSNMVLRQHGMTVQSAMELADHIPNVTFFFIVKQPMFLGADKGGFSAGDAVFFSGEPWYGSAPGMADAYEKRP